MLVENINHFEKRKYPSQEKIIKTQRRYIYYFEKNPDLQLSLLPRLLSVFILVFTTWTRTFFKVYIKCRIINLIFFIQQFPSDWNIRTNKKIISCKSWNAKKKKVQKHVHTTLYTFHITIMYYNLKWTRL